MPFFSSTTGRCSGCSIAPTMRTTASRPSAVSASSVMTYLMPFGMGPLMCVNASESSVSSAQKFSSAPRLRSQPPKRPLSAMSTLLR